MKIYIGSDHAGYDYKKDICEYLKNMDIEVIECMHLEYDSDDDYIDAALDVTNKLINDDNSIGILICGTGIGMWMAANKQKNIRAAVCHNEYEARLTRLHNNANILCLGARTIGKELACEIVKTFIETKFTNEERHIRRIERLG